MTIKAIFYYCLAGIVGIVAVLLLFSGVAKVGSIPTGVGALLLIKGAREQAERARKN